ncbi:ATP-binding protein [Croceicoccus mobilis]|uniref:histidine kinase n=1 Tax=Croceicoccus mobilis TaxID=1703339 RepID=A0A917DSL1_9SPHN|nr:ATP-binding protein [Croceicoccus mobilis]GGD64793.1 hypothetical protein GCM10010990_12870 [Croceicoccus mobilis]
MKSARSIGLTGRLLAILLVVVALDFIINAVVFERASEFSLQEEDTHRMAERLVVAYRILDDAAPERREPLIEELTTKHLAIDWREMGTRRPASLELDKLRQQMIAFEGDLARTGLRLHLAPLSEKGDISGSMILTDRSVVNFTLHAHEAGRLNAERLVALALPTLLLMALGVLLVKKAMQPLRGLITATRRVGDDNKPIPLPGTGSGEVRQLIEAFNVMQERIHHLLHNRRLTISAIAHDLRTPLTRLQMRLENSEIDSEERAAMEADLAEMRHLLESLQVFNQTGSVSHPREMIDVAASAMTLVDDAIDRGYPANYEGPGHLEIKCRPLSLRRIMSNLVENALHYAGDASLSIGMQDGELVIVVEDTGPGIPEQYLEDVLEPFTRLDEARSRDTRGMGLGLAIVDRIVRAEGGRFKLANRKAGGLRATVLLPLGE